MSNTLTNGQRINLSNILNDIKKVKIEITYELKDSYSILGSKLNFLAFCLNEDKKFINKHYLVNRINNKTPDNAVSYYKSLNNENIISFIIDFEKINSSIKKIIFALSLENDIFDDSDKFQFLKRLEVKLSSLDKLTFFKFDVPLNFSNETTIEIFEIYNKDFQWRAVGYFYGYIGNLGLLTEKYGLQLENENYFDEKQFESSITEKEVSTSNEPLNKKFKSYQEKLLDLSKKNPLINIKPKSIIEFQIPDMYEIFNLVQENKNILISPIPEDFDLYREEVNEIISVKKKKELTSLLYRIKNRASSSMEEQGINILFLSFGLLTWGENENSSDKFVSPIILVPVELTKDSLNSPYKLKLLDDEIIVNPALNTKLKNQYGKQLADLPEEFTSLSLKDYFEDLQNIFKNLPNYIFEEKASLGIFSFNKLILYKDLEEYSDLINEHPLLNGKGNINSDIKNIEDYKADKLDNKIASKDTFQVLDADSSQQEAIILAKKGVSFVLQGPPGTGKSQTITNIIAECISDGKSVLFVSEKMAALEVVQKRLVNCGLGDFCLELHSNKTSKAKVISDLEKSLMLEQKKIKGNVEDELGSLDNLKNQLNLYINSLHQSRGAMGFSCYHGQANLAKLDKIELLFFNIPDVLNLSKKTWEQINGNLIKLSNLKTVFPNVDKNPWKNINLDSLTIEKEILIKKNLDELVNKTDDLVKAINQYSEKTSLKELKNIFELEKWFEETNFIFSTKKPLFTWLKSDYKIEELKKFTYKKSSEFKKYKEDKTIFIEKYKIDFFNQNLIDGFIKEYNVLIDFFGKDIPGQYINCKSEIFKTFSNFKTNFESLSNSLDVISKRLEINKPETFIEINYLIKLFTYIEQEQQLQENWYDEKFLNELLFKIDDAKVKSDDFIKKFNKFTKNYGKDILSLDITSLLNRFENDYNSIFKIFNPLYKADLKHIAGLVNNIDLKYMDALDILKKAEIIYKEKQLFDENKIKYFKIFGFYYNGENTDWSKVKKHIENSINLVKWFSGKDIPQNFKIILKGGIELEKIKTLANQIIENYSNIKKIAEQLNDNEIKIKFDYDLKISDFADNIYKKSKDFNYLWTFYNKLKEYSNDNTFFFNFLEQDFNKILEIIKYENDFKQFEFVKIYSQYFKGFETDWEEIKKIILWTIDCKNRISSEKWQNLFSNLEPILKAISSNNELMSLLKDEKIIIEKKFTSFQKSFFEFINLFSNNTLKINNIDINLIEFSYLNKWFINLRDNFESLKEWFVFKDVDKFFKLNGIPNFIQEVDKNKLFGNLIKDSFYKRFYQLWLDNVYTSEPLLNKFNGNERNNLIKDFAKIDLKSLEISKARLQVYLREKIPKQDIFEMQSSEYGILNTEITKKRKHKPLRRLFSEIKNLLFNLKPCFMMSPLSVCQFIDPHKINFDLVIFDEASQIFPEDAVSAILRAKQTIIVGDKKQMPPSNFFRFVETDDSDEFNEDDVTEYESILDEFSNMGLPSRMLKWHYRSKDESLISFSNKHFYENSLWTFPNKNMENKAIEFIPVQGIYDRGHTRQNRIEAEKIADLVFEHFRKHQDKLSLGVITFSEAQQMAVLAEIERKRMENQELENFFESNDSEHFFVKSIEHVQGDERDVIFFSVGYGRDASNKLSYFFGPLNQTGGERRLNVAITRARQHIKLVSSIDYNDLDPERLNSKGSKLLRSYLEYAKMGKSALINEIKINEHLSFDSPFEEYVYDELIKIGYKVKTQVGSSGYRIDLGIIDPEHSGRFLLGIECDGASYHSSKTARDRDRLRQQILEGLGWKIHRIWSRDWVSNQKNEIDKIQKALQDAKESCEKIQNLEQSIDVIDILETSKSSKNRIENSFKKYQALNIGILGSSDEFHQDIYTNSISSAIFRIVSHESPVSISSVTKRITNAWNMTRSGQKIQTRIKTIINNLDEHIRLDSNDFLWKIGMEIPEVRIAGDFRSIDDISKEEFAEASRLCLKNTFSAEKDELIRVVANLFDFQKISSGIRDKISQSIDLYLDKGLFIEEDNIIKLNNKS